MPPPLLAARGWRSPLAIGVSGLLLVEALTGLWIYLAPFSVATQVQVLLHTVAGFALLVPYAIYQVRHFLAWYRQKVTAVMVLGYLLATAVTVCAASGVVLTVEAAVGPRLSSVWDITHLVSGLVVVALVPLHFAVALVRRRRLLLSLPEFALGVRRFARGGGLWVGLTALSVALLAWTSPRQAVEFAPPEGYTLPEFAQQFEEYRGNPFAPTFARTESGLLVHPEVLSGSLACGSSGCHEQILAEWLPSAHRFSAMNPPFQAVQKSFAQDREPAETRYCAGCHDPISLFAGAKDIHNLDLSAPGIEEGSSCAVCHSISQVDQRGNADYVLTPPRKYLWEDATGWRKLVSDFLIRAYPRQHLADYDRNLLRTPEFCGACHKQFIPEALNRFGLSPGQNQYDEWRKSHWHADDPEKDLSCRDCHMRLVTSSRDPGRGEAGDVRRSAGDGAHRHHGFIATNFFMPEVLALPGWERHVELTREWIRGDTVIPEIAHLWPGGPVASLELAAPEEARPGEEVTVRAVTTNRKAGHNLITGPLDFMRAWIHLRVIDAAGSVLAEWGAIDLATRRINDAGNEPHRIGNSRKEGTLVLEGQPLDAEGRPLVRHELWEKAGGMGQRIIFPGYTDHQSYRFTVPARAVGPLRVEADLNFRRYRQEFLDLVLPEMERESGVYQSMATQSSARAEIAIRAGAPPSVTPAGAQGGGQ